jgi:tetratricopeptide (TPR) repeat protein
MGADAVGARTLVARASEIYEELAQSSIVVTMCDSMAAFVDALVGDFAAAEERRRLTCEQYERIGERSSLATQAAELAEALYAQGRFDEAGKAAGVAEGNAGATDVSAQFSWRAAAAKVRARRGEPAEATVLAEEALRLAETTDGLNQRANVHLAHAEVLRISGSFAEADRAVARATALFEQKGNVVAAARARALAGARVVA